MLFTKALKRELRSIAGIVFAILFTIMVTTSLVRFLGRAAGGRVDSASVLPLIAFSALNILGPLLVLTLFIAVLMTLTRAWRDSEMVVWQASGQSLAAWIRPVLGFAMPIVLLAGLVSFVLSPWASAQITEYQRRFDNRSDVSMVAAGQFSESRSSNRVFFVESVNEDQTEVRNVFVLQDRPEGLITVVAQRGLIETRADGERYLVLLQGRRYDGGLADASLRLMEFDRYGLRIEPRPPAVRDSSSKAKSLLDLLDSPGPADYGELVRRIGVPISAVLLAILAIPLSSANPRVGRSINLVVAILLYVIYLNLLSLTQAWVAQERLPFWIGVWCVHAGAALLAGTLFWQRLSLTRRRLLPRMNWPRLRRDRPVSVVAS